MSEETKTPERQVTVPEGYEVILVPHEDSTEYMQMVDGCACAMWVAQYILMCEEPPCSWLDFKMRRLDDSVALKGLAGTILKQAAGMTEERLTGVKPDDVVEEGPRIEIAR